jgi:hypothetical protein
LMITFIVPPPPSLPCDRQRSEEKHRDGCFVAANLSHLASLHGDL